MHLLKVREVKLVRSQCGNVFVMVLGKKKLGGRRGKEERGGLIRGSGLKVKTKILGLKSSDTLKLKLSGNKILLILALFLIENKLLMYSF